MVMILDNESSLNIFFKKVTKMLLALENNNKLPHNDNQ